MRTFAPGVSELMQKRVVAGSLLLELILEDAATISHGRGDAEIHAVALYATIAELFSSCLLLASQGEPTAIPIILRSMYEAMVDLDNLVTDAGYVEHMKAANLLQMIRLMNSTPLKEELRREREEDRRQFAVELAELEAREKGPLKIKRRCKNVGRLDEYESLYGMFCLDTHNNASALAERHITETDDGGINIAFFGDYDPDAVIRRLDFGLTFLLSSARMIHGAFRIPSPRIDEAAAKLERERAASGTLGT